MLIRAMMLQIYGISIENIQQDIYFRHFNRIKYLDSLLIH